MYVFALCKDASCRTDMGTGGRDRGQRQLLISKLGDSPPPSLLITRKQKMTPPPPHTLSVMV